MGKKARKEREEERESFAVKRSREKRKNLMMAAAVFGVIALIVGYSVIVFWNMQGTTPGAPPGSGTLGDEHEHTSILVRIFGDKFPSPTGFSSPAYQIKSTWIHFEGSDGSTIHRHSSVETLSITLNDECLVFQSQEGQRNFCTNEEFSLKFYINHLQVDGITDYVINEDDRVLISYGNETPEEIEEQLQELDTQAILR
jgi:hypothetical protein